MLGTDENAAAIAAELCVARAMSLMDCSINFGLNDVPKLPEASVVTTRDEPTWDERPANFPEAPKLGMIKLLEAVPRTTCPGAVVRAPAPIAVEPVWEAWAPAPTAVA